jgi:hypothetical protein
MFSIKLKLFLHLFERFQSAFVPPDSMLICNWSSESLKLYRAIFGAIEWKLLKSIESKSRDL